MHAPCPRHAPCWSEKVLGWGPTAASGEAESTSRCWGSRAPHLPEPDQECLRWGRGGDRMGPPVKSSVDPPVDIASHQEATTKDISGLCSLVFGHRFPCFQQSWN